MDIIRSTVLSTSLVPAKKVDREVVIAVFGFSVAQARADAVSRFTRENGHPEARVEVVSHAVIERPRSGDAWTKHGTYHVTLRVSGELHVG
jgi:hypothetical protein